MHSIIFANGEHGYAFYGESNGFPDAYKSPLKALFSKQHILKQTGSYHSNYGIRYAPFEDMYLLSFVIHDCCHEAEERRMFASANFLFTDEEMDTALRNPRSFLEQTIASGLTYLTDNRYIIEDVTPPSVMRFPRTADEECAMFTAAHRATADRDNPIVYIGASLPQALSSVVWLLSSLPRWLKKQVSYYVGAETMSESFGIDLVFMPSDTLTHTLKYAAYDGAPAGAKLFVLNGSIQQTSSVRVKRTVSPPAQAYAALSEDGRECLKRLFFSSDDATLFWQSTERLLANGTVGFFDAELLKDLGDEWFTGAIQGELVPKDALQQLLAFPQLYMYPRVQAQLEQLFPAPSPDTVAIPSPPPTFPADPASVSPPDAEDVLRDIYASDEDRTDLSKSDTSDIADEHAEGKQPDPTDAAHRRPRRRRSSAVNAADVVIFVLCACLLSLTINAGLFVIGVDFLSVDAQTGGMSLRLTPIGLAAELLIASLVNMPIGYCIIRTIRNYTKHHK